MANRSYLYSANVIPSDEVKKEDLRLIGISEWDYEIPLVYELLLTGAPTACKSSIWEVPDNIAIAADYARGVDRLRGFLKEVDLPEAQAMIQSDLASA